MRRATDLQLNLIILLVLVSAVTQASASDQQKMLPPPGPPPGRRAHVGDVFPPPPMVPAFGDNSLFSSAVKKHANGDLEGAIAGYMALIKVQDKDPAVHWYLGTAYKAVGKEMEARREFEKEHEMKRIIDKELRTKSGVEILPAGDFGSNELLFVPGEGLKKWDER